MNIIVLESVNHVYCAVTIIVLVIMEVSRERERVHTNKKLSYVTSSVIWMPMLQH